jgi:hypothetical protein
MKDHAAVSNARIGLNTWAAAQGVTSLRRDPLLLEGKMCERRV